MRLYLNGVAMVKAGWVVETGINSQNKKEKHLCFGSFERIFIPNDQKPFITTSPGEPAPEHIKEFVSAVSGDGDFDSNYSLFTSRKPGKYVYKGATAILEKTDNGGGRHYYHIRLWSSNQKDLESLYDLVREGKIWPVVNYGVFQIPQLLRHFTSPIREFLRLARETLSRS